MHSFNSRIQLFLTMTTNNIFLYLFYRKWTRTENYIIRSAFKSCLSQRFFTIIHYIDLIQMYRWFFLILNPNLWTILLQHSLRTNNKIQFYFLQQYQLCFQFFYLNQLCSTSNKSIQVNLSGTKKISEWNKWSEHCNVSFFSYEFSNAR